MITGAEQTNDLAVSWYAKHMHPRQNIYQYEEIILTQEEFEYLDTSNLTGWNIEWVPTSDDRMNVWLTRKRLKISQTITGKDFYMMLYGGE